MNESQVVTLEDLRKFLEEKYESEWKNLPIDEIVSKQDSILRTYELTQAEYEYASKLKLITEAQVVKNTIINTKKAYEILLKRK